MPASSHTCLLIIDMINEFTFEQAERLFPAIEQTAQRIAALKRSMKKADVPVIYINDNFGTWRSDFRGLVTRCLQDGCRGREVARVLAPDEDDYFILKPKHSAFFATPLELLLNVLDAHRLVLTGVAGNNCVLYTAADAYMREFEVTVPSDCTISLDPEANHTALAHMQETLKADISPSDRVISRVLEEKTTLLH
jgi:nicotinamidase-related amidase